MLYNETLEVGGAKGGESGSISPKGHLATSKPKGNPDFRRSTLGEEQSTNVHVVTDKDSTGTRRRREGKGTRRQKYSEVSGCVRRDEGGSKEVKSY